jgi:hypothetical protein
LSKLAPFSPIYGGQRGGIKSSPKNLYPSKGLGALKQEELGRKKNPI